MHWFSALAVYLLFWVVCLFFMLPVGVRTAEEEGKPLVPGQAQSAPTTPNIWRKLLWTTLLSTAMFALFIANWTQGWITRADLEALLPF